MLGALLTLTLSIGAPEQDPIVNRALYDKGVEFLEAGQFEEASALFGELYRRTSDPWALYNRAQAERLKGDCDAAIPLYRAFLAVQQKIDERDRFQARKNIERCGGDPDAPVAGAVDPAGSEANTGGKAGPDEPAEAEEPKSKAKSKRKKKPPRRTRRDDDPLPPPPILANAPTSSEPNLLDRPRKANPVARDPLGWSLAGTGVLAIVIGTPLYVLGNREANLDSTATDLTEDVYVDRVEDGQRQRAAGAALIGTGAALAAGSALRFIILAVRNKRGGGTIARF